MIDKQIITELGLVPATYNNKHIPGGLFYWGTIHCWGESDTLELYISDVKLWEKAEPLSPNEVYLLILFPCMVVDESGALKIQERKMMIPVSKDELLYRAEGVIRQVWQWFEY